MIDGQNLFDQLVNIDLGKYDNVLKIMKSQENDYATSWLLDYPCFK